ncbi:MAG: hypothetical protein ACR2N3_19290 [Pyrinomonadaceae bacterium]
MKKIFLNLEQFFTFWFVVLIFCVCAFGQKTELIPKSAMILETQTVTPKRKMVLWMPTPEKHPNETPGEEYTCPDETRGSYYTGKLRVTLVNSETNRQISTLEVKDDDNSAAEIDIPYAIRGGYFYVVPNGSRTQERKPQIMALKDYNGDGKAQEFALYDKEACQGLATMLIGYDEKEDKIIQYPIELSNNGKTEIIYWADLLFWIKPISNGVWNYKIDYRGRGGTLDKYEIRYDKKKEMFVGSLTSTASEND